MNRGYQPWDPERFLKQEMSHFWKDESQMKKNYPLCGARCRNGQPCRAKAFVNKLTNTPVNGRCRMHGGLSTGAKTVEGKERCRQAAIRGMKEYWKRKKV